MLVVLKRDWFTGERRYRKSSERDPTEIPEELRSQLPKSAKVLDAPIVGPPEPQVNLLRDFDTARAAGKAEDDAVTKAEKFQRELKAEQVKKGKT